MSQAVDWNLRMVGASSGMPLGFIAELWRPIEAWPGIGNIAERARARGRSPDGFDLRKATSRALLVETVNAAQAVMYTVDKIETLVSEVQAWVEEAVPPIGPDEEAPLYGRDVGHPNLTCASWEFANLLAWLRTLEERIERPAYRAEGRAGLLPMLNPLHPITPNVRSLVEALRSGALGDRRLTNLVLHNEVVPSPHQGARLTNDSRVVVRIPDRLEERVDLALELSYGEDRELLALAQRVADDVGQFVDGLLGEFEVANEMRNRGEIPPH